MDFNEEEFKNEVEPQIKRCRPGDWEHCQRAVRWIKKLASDRDDLPLLIMAGYIIDLGWKDILQVEKVSFGEIKKYEEKANRHSERFITTLLLKLGYSVDDIKKVIRLVKAVDAHKSKKDDEAVVVDADNLGKLDMNYLKEKYRKSDWMQVYEKLWVKEMPKRIRTEKGKNIYPLLLRMLKKEILKEIR